MTDMAASSRSHFRANRCVADRPPAAARQDRANAASAARRTAIAGEKHAERVRADMVAANEAQPIELGLVGNLPSHVGKA